MVFYAYELIEEEDCKRFMFKTEYEPEIFGFLLQLLAGSTNKQIHFTSDWQFSPNTAAIWVHALTFEQFLNLYGMEGLPFNTWISIKG